MNNEQFETANIKKKIITMIPFDRSSFEFISFIDFLLLYVK